MPSNVFCLMGPTASGKTAVACELVKHFPFEIISVDSAMIYRDMNIGTAKPTTAELIDAPHHLIDIIDPTQAYSAAQFCSDVSSLIKQIVTRGNLPLLVGGTMMYFHALQQGLSKLPEADLAIRQQLTLQAEQEGWESLHAQLARVDPIAANRIHKNDTQRIQRALEVYLLTDKPITDWLAQEEKQSNHTFINMALFPKDRAWLHQRIAQRFDLMLEQDFIGEVQKLLSEWQLPLTSPAMRCVGYRQARDYIEGLDTLGSFREKGIAATRQLAKRQLTWLRHWQNSTTIDCDTADCNREVMAIVQKILDNAEK